MKINLTQDVFENLDYREIGRIKSILKRKEKIETLKVEMSDIHEDVKNAQDLLYLHSIEQLKNRGLKESVEVIYKPTNTKHTITAFYLDRENDIMAVILNPIPKLKKFEMPYAFQLKLVEKRKKRKYNGK